MDNLRCKSCTSEKFIIKDEFPFFRVTCDAGHFFSKMLAASNADADSNSSNDAEQNDAPTDTNDFICRFGKHRGKKWEDVPIDYLKYCIDNFDDSKNRRRMELELNNREGVQL